MSNKEYREYVDWSRRIDKAKLKESNKRRCYLCGRMIPRGNVYCFSCQEEIDNALCDYDNWPFGG